MSTTATSAPTPITDRLPDAAREAGCRSLVDVYRLRAERQPDVVGYRFLPGGGAPELELTYAALDRRARAIANALVERARPGERAILLFTPGLEYITAFVACLYAGIVAVPAYPPHPRRPDARVPGLVEDCGARIALTTSTLMTRLARWRASEPTIDAMHWVATDAVEATETRWCPERVGSERLAMLQYTSGSTSAPRGVRLTHANLMANLESVFHRFAHREGDIGVFWLPPFHDMGLIGAILQPAYVGCSVVVMPPANFLQRPMAWLEAMSRFGGTTSGAPNFAYDLCVDRSTPDQRAALDLSSWRTAFNGAEPVRAETLDRFARAFEVAGFRRAAFMPCYGLAEATLMVSGGPAGAPPTVLCVSRKSLEQGRLELPATDADTARLVGSGTPVDGHSVRIVDPATGIALQDGTVGEIWVSGPSVGDGYWTDDDVGTFDARLAADGGRRWLRTGDLGALRDDELVVTGRLKDLIIVRGRNLHPQDVEAAADRSHPDLRSSHAAAFAVPTASGDGLAIALELSRHAEVHDHAAVFASVRHAVADRVGVVPDEVVLVRLGTIPRTSSGKIRRRATRDAFLDGTLELIARDGSRAPARAARPPGDARAWLRQWIIDEMGTDPNAGDGATLRDLGIESLDTVRLVVDAERELGVRLDTAALWAARDVGALVQLLEGRNGHASAESAPIVPTTEPRGMAELEERFTKLQAAGLANPFFMLHDGVSGDTTIVDGRELTSFASYNYLGLAGHPEVIAASVDATHRFGTSVSASRLISGERSIHRELERELAAFVGTEDALTFVSGHATNVSTIPCLVGDGDLVVADALAHDSIVQGARLSGARRLVFPHNDWQALDAMLRDLRSRYRRALVVIEGVYSADGDVPDLARFVELKRRHSAILMLDEAHSLGVLGATGRGLPEAAGVGAGDVDLIMGTLSKALASSGGYVMGSARLVRHLRYAAAAFVFSVGLAPATAAAALQALRVLRREPERVQRLRDNARYFLGLLQAAGVDTGASAGTAVVPAIVGDSLRAVRISQHLHELGVSAPPMVAPAVPEHLARIRFFVTAEHGRAQLEQAASAAARAMREIPE